MGDDGDHLDGMSLWACIFNTSGAWHGESTHAIFELLQWVRWVESMCASLCQDLH